MSQSTRNRYKDKISDGSKERSRSRSPIKDDSDSSKEVKLTNVGLGAKNRLKNMSIQMKLNSIKAASSSNKPKLSVASAFNQDSDDEPEEMPPEARMRMRNIGRNTPTSSGPNSFGKTKQGFSDSKKLFEKSLKDVMDSTKDGD